MKSYNPKSIAITTLSFLVIALSTYTAFFNNVNRPKVFEGFPKEVRSAITEYNLLAKKDLERAEYFFEGEYYDKGIKQMAQAVERLDSLQGFVSKNSLDLDSLKAVIRNVEELNILCVEHLPPIDRAANKIIRHFEADSAKGINALFDSAFVDKQLGNILTRYSMIHQRASDLYKQVGGSKIRKILSFQIDFTASKLQDSQKSFENFAKDYKSAQAAAVAKLLKEKLSVLRNFKKL